MRLANNVKTAFLLGSLMALCMFVGHSVAGPSGLIMGFLFGGLGNIIAFFFSDKMAMAAMGGQEIRREDLPWLYDMIARLAQRGNLPMPRVYVCPQAAPNAFATGRGPSNAAVAITQGMLRDFPPAEIEGVMAHELAHIKHRDMLISTIASVMAGVISSIGYLAFYMGGSHNRDGENQNPLGAVGAILMIILAPIAAGLIQMAISRQREFAADSYGGELCGDPMKLAYALRRLGRMNEVIPTETNPAFHNLYIVEPLHGDGVMNLFSTHPPLAKRIALLEEQARQM